ncbi:unnamed protein product [Gadus morhua 'NCC']
MREAGESLEEIQSNGDQECGGEVAARYRGVRYYFAWKDGKRRKRKRKEKKEEPLRAEMTTMFSLRTGHFSAVLTFSLSPSLSVYLFFSWHFPLIQPVRH